MTITELIKVADNLSLDDIRRLRQHLTKLEQRKLQEAELRVGTMDIDTVLAGIHAMREGLSAQDFDEMIETMNSETIETIDEQAWKF